MTPARRGYLDWLRGLAVLIMIEAHVLDAWTAVAERSRSMYGYAMILGGFGAPMFLFLAGVSLPLAMASRIARGKSPAAAAAAAVRRGWQIFGLAFLFRLQSWVISGGDPYLTLLKVDILNIMGIAMLGTAALWYLGRGPGSRALIYIGVTIALAMTTPIVRASPWLDALPDPIEWYLRPPAGRGTFTIVPWAGFLVAGAVVGLALASRPAGDESRLQGTLAVGGLAVALAGYGASYLPPIYDQTSFWTSSPTFFFLRLGILVCLVPLAYAWERRAPPRSWSPLGILGVASLFVYWIHVEMVYGVLSAPLRRRLTLEQAVMAIVVFTGFLFLLVLGKNRLFRKSLST